MTIDHNILYFKEDFHGALTICKMYLPRWLCINLQKIECKLLCTHLPTYCLSRILLIVYNYKDIIILPKYQLEKNRSLQYLVILIQHS